MCVQAQAGSLIAGPAEPYRWPLSEDPSAMEQVVDLFSDVSRFLFLMVGPQQNTHAMLSPV